MCITYEVGQQVYINVTMMQIVITQVHSKDSEVQTKLSLWALEKIKSVVYLMKYREQKSYLVLAAGYYIYLLLRALW